MSTQDDILTVEEAGEYLKVSKYTIWRMIKRGDIPAKKAGRRWRISRFAILKWLEDRGTANTPDSEQQDNVNEQPSATVE